jgi:chaperone modulatory protein CbpM
METKIYFLISEACEKLGVDKSYVIHCIKSDWIHPAHSAKLNDSQLDSEDLARIQLIIDLQNIFGINDEGIPIVLHLLDQLYSLKKRIQLINDTDEKSNKIAS